MKSKRQKIILEIISSKDIETQHQLLKELESRGFHTTQATVSRDIKDMHLVKELGASGAYKYTVSTAESFSNHKNKLRMIFRESVTSVECAQNLIVLKTLPGLANGACSALDGMEISELVGTLAGDDTAFLAMKDNASAAAFCSEIRAMLS
ncbi:MAG: arginine repressor [Oscillospiraceae bacterium]